MEQQRREIFVLNISQVWLQQISKRWQWAEYRQFRKFMISVPTLKLHCMPARKKVLCSSFILSFKCARRDLRSVHDQNKNGKSNRVALAHGEWRLRVRTGRRGANPAHVQLFDKSAEGSILIPCPSDPLSDS